MRLNVLTTPGQIFRFFAFLVAVVIFLGAIATQSLTQAGIAVAIVAAIGLWSGATRRWP
jgi:hypothetical protein